MKRIKLFTHTDLDGVGCSVIGDLAYGADIDIEYCNYNDVNEKVQEFIKNWHLSEHDTYSYCYITDISVNEETAKLINNEVETCISWYGDQCISLIDHHKTANWLNQYGWATVKSKNEIGVKECGTTLFYDYLVAHKICSEKPKYRQFAQIVRLYDTWQWNNDSRFGQLAKDLNDVLHMIGIDEFLKTYTIEIIKNIYEDFELTEMHRQLLKYKRKEIETYINNKLKQVQIISDKHNNYGVVFADSNISELGDACLENYNIDYIAMYNGTGYSLRSRKGFDCSTVAKKYGGGGHEQSCGFLKKIDLTI